MASEGTESDSANRAIQALSVVVKEGGNEAINRIVELEKENKKLLETVASLQSQLTRLEVRWHFTLTLTLALSEDFCCDTANRTLQALSVVVKEGGNEAINRVVELEKKNKKLLETVAILQSQLWRVEMCHNCVEQPAVQVSCSTCGTRWCEDCGLEWRRCFACPYDHRSCPNCSCEKWQWKCEAEAYSYTR